MNNVVANRANRVVNFGNELLFGERQDALVPNLAIGCEVVAVEVLDVGGGHKFFGRNINFDSHQLEFVDQLADKQHLSKDSQ